MIVTRYISRRLVNISLSVLAILLILGLSVEIVRNLDKLVVAVSAGKTNLVVKYFSFKLIFMFCFLVPSSLSIAGGLCFASLWRTNEITAMLTSGMTKLRLLSSSIVTAIIAGFLLFSIDEFLLPSILPEILSIENDIKARDVTNGVTSVDKSGSRLDAGLFDRKRLYLEDVEVIMIGENLEKRKTVKAKKGNWDHKTSSWILYDGQVAEYEGGMIKVIVAGDKTFRAVTNILDEGYVVGEGLFKPKTFHESKMTLVIGTKMHRLRTLIKAYPEITLYKSGMSLKFSNIFLSMCLALPCILLVINRQIKSFALSVTIALICNLIFYTIHLTSIRFGIVGLLEPYSSVFITPLSFLAYSVYLLFK